MAEEDDPDPSPPIPDFPIPPVPGQHQPHTGRMAIRIGVQADSEEECVEALAQLVDAGYLPVMLPKYLTDGRWMARAVPTTKAPVREDRGPVASGT